MSNTFNWQEAIHDPRFWAVRYGGQFPGVTDEEIDSYIDEHDFLNLAILEDDPLAGYVGEGDDPQLAEVEVGYRRLALSFPEGYLWLMDFAAEDGEHMTGIYHAIFHPDMDPAGFLHPTSTGLSLAEESGHQRLPGLRWAELKQIQTCLAKNWHSDFDVQAVVPLLYPVIELITFDELDDVRQTLATAWQELHMLDSAQVEQWLDETIEVYEKGWVLHFDSQKEWRPNPYQKQPYPQEDLWIQTEERRWQTFHPSSERYFKKDSRQFSPFFSILEWYA